jgi:glutathione peroxidase
MFANILLKKEIVMIRSMLLGLLLGPVAAQACPELLNESYRPLAGKEAVNLCDQFEGKVLLVVNTASKCGFTPQYEGLEKLHASLQARGFSVVGFPSNDFMGQEPGTEDDIKEFCTLTYGVKFPMFEKVHVVGDDTTSIYRKLEQATGDAPAWNFHKYLVDREGKVVASFGSRTKPDDPKLAEQIDALLSAPAPVPAPSTP